MQQALFGSAFSTPVTIDIATTNVADRRYRDAVSATSGLPQRVYIYSNGDDISGDVKVGVGGGKRLDHLGIKVELKGIIGMSGYTQRLRVNKDDALLDTRTELQSHGKQAFHLDCCVGVSFGFARRDQRREGRAQPRVCEPGQGAGGAGRGIRAAGALDGHPGRLEVSVTTASCALCLF